MKKFLCIVLTAVSLLLITVPSFADSTSNNIGHDANKVYIQVGSEYEARNLINQINQDSKYAIQQYKNAVKSEKSQNPNYSYEEAIMVQNDGKPISSLSNMKTSDDTTQKITYNYIANDKLHCYINYTTTVNKYGATVFDTIIGKHLYCENASTVRNVDYSSSKYLENRRTYAFTYSCTVVLTWTTGNSTNSAEVKATQYCEFYASGRCYPS